MTCPNRKEKNMKIVKTDEKLKKVFEKGAALTESAEVTLRALIEMQAKFIMDHRTHWGSIKQLAKEQFPDLDYKNLKYDHIIREFFIVEASDDLP